MFDDQIPNNSGQVPPNLPLGEPEDMFGKVPSEAIPSSATTPMQMSPQEDADFAVSAPVVKSAVSAGVLRPKQNSEQTEPVDMFTASTEDDDLELPPISPSYTPSYNQNPAQPTQTPQSYASQDMRMTTPPQEMMGGQNQMYEVSEPLGKKRIVMWVIILIVVAILGLGSFWIYFSFIRNVDPVDEFSSSNTQTEQIPEQDEVVVTSDQTQTPQTTTNTEDEFNLENQILLGEPLDTDGDGLTDVRESELGTSPLNWDTDSDKLGDYEEITIWKTDPLNADTDGDGYGDNEEIENGYNPKGTGKLFQPPTTTEEGVSSTQS
jgi:hypothetical protein